MQAKHFYEFGPFRIDTGERVLLRRPDTRSPAADTRHLTADTRQPPWRPVPLTPKAFDTLLVLVENRGHILEKDQLMQRIWPDTFVEEANLANNISLLRKILGESEAEQTYIETIPKRGYRFSAAVRELRDDELAGETAVNARAGSGRNAGDKPLSEVLEWRIEEAAGEGPHRHRIKSMAVLPFKPILIDNRDEALELGMADTLITALSSLKDVVVRPTSTVRNYTSLEQDPVAIGRELRVEWVLDGSVQKLGEKVRVTVRLVNVADSLTLWAEKFDEKFTDIFAVQDSISERVAGGLASKLTGEEERRLTKRYTESAEAYQAYLKGRYFWDKSTPDGIAKAIEYFKQAIGIDANYALAYAGLADSYILLGVHGVIPQHEAVPKARAAAKKALEIDGTLAEAHFSLAVISRDYELDWPEAERHYRRAIELNPNSAPAHHWYSFGLSLMGRFDEAFREAKRAQEIDPLSLPINANVGVIFSMARQYDQAIEQYQKTIEMDPNFYFTHFLLGLVYVQKGMHDEAVSELQKARTLSDYPDTIALLGYTYAVSGKKKEALKLLDELSRRRYVQPFAKAMIYTGLGDKDRALEWWEKAYEDRDWHVWVLKEVSFFEPLRSEPRFQDLLRRLGFTP